MAWFDELREDTILNIHIHCQRCMESQEHSTIELLAYFISLAEGRPEGRALQHWLEAEELFAAECQFQVASRLEPNIWGQGCRAPEGT